MFCTVLPPLPSASPSPLLPSSHPSHTGALLISFLSVLVSVSHSFSFSPSLNSFLLCCHPLPPPSSPPILLFFCDFNKSFFRDLLHFHHSLLCSPFSHLPSFLSHLSFSLASPSVCPLFPLCENAFCKN